MEDLKYENGQLLHRYDESIPEGSVAVLVPTYEAKDGEFYAPGPHDRNVAFLAQHFFFTRDPGAAEPPPKYGEVLTVDGEMMRLWGATGWVCESCRTRFFVSRRSDLRHSPCFDERGSFPNK